MTLQEREQHAKKVVNKIRKEHGLRALGKLKRGIPQHWSSCTVANSLEGTPFHGAAPDEAPGLVWLFTKGKRELIHDEVLSHFMLDFDAGKYPHLELPRTPVKIKYAGHRKSTVIE